MPLNLYLNTIVDNFHHKSQAQYSWVDNPNVLKPSIVPCEVIILIY